MAAIIGMTPFGTRSSNTYTTPVRNIDYVELSEAIYDELSIREKTTDIDKTTSKETWHLDTILLARFMGDLEAGNVNNEGIKIDKFAIKRRKVGELNSITVGYKDFVNNNQFEFEDYTQPNGEFIYSVVPIGENGLEGQENSITLISEFAGFHLVDKDSGEVLSFDKFIGSEPTVNTALNQGRTQIDTFSKFPSFFYNNQNYHTFSLQAVFMRDEWENVGKKYDDVISKFIYTHKPFIVKGGDGSIYVVEASSPTKDVPMNAYRGREYMTLSLNCTEIMDYDEYMKL